MLYELYKFYEVLKYPGFCSLDKNKLEKIKDNEKYNCDNYEKCGNTVQTFILIKKPLGYGRIFYRIAHYLLCEICFKKKKKKHQEYINEMKKFEEKNLDRCIDKYDFDYECCTFYGIYIKEYNYTQPLCHFCYNNCTNLLDNNSFTLKKTYVRDYHKKYALCSCKKIGCSVN